MRDTRRYVLTLFDDAGGIDVIRPRSLKTLHGLMDGARDGGCVVIGRTSTAEALHYVMRTSACPMFVGYEGDAAPVTP